MSLQDASETIAALATAAGRGGVGIVRVSGPLCPAIARRVLGFEPNPRQAHYSPFLDAGAEPIDQGIALYFPAPHSFTGEDVLELQGHGGPVVLDLLLRRITQLGARLARPGEFSERAFLNDKLDLAQAEAIADLIDASSAQAARNAMHSLQGAFSRRIGNLVEALIALRIYVEAAIDFPEEEIDFLSDGKVAADLEQIIQDLQSLLQQAHQGALVRDGMKVVIAGRPNAGKSSLLNALSGRDSAIVTDIAGTTRDILREHIHIDGMPLHIIDTAGLREATDEVERIGIERAGQEIAAADRVLLLLDSSIEDTDPETVLPVPVPPERLTRVLNKADLSNTATGLLHSGPPTRIGISAKTGAGLATLKQHLKDCMGYTGAGESGFTARRRHLDALERAQGLLITGRAQLQSLAAGELLAEDLRQAQNALGEITGAFTPDDLLGRIFSSFCIGK
ncbi:tRNA uridine-5-carboxymethylaminomethyl(34) synthesis GTPase MnmE [Exilibacterium tricleocarpae]|uniref:tRNA modification GTPase MnmE n=1 Tax=Exilibacterium tricleocarpae TaxID=2591008 RepID=A0A545TZS0_9GAMM|nr:tRNA uridine-5-carboxymethylaminomethyl(34) synthesis GTPase MnmE [Exilibacterium tricleocarpae]TQV82710.1 tRNA uridine-5-carboxymethylaminomethyl(34) synthesis GTPase MnmE [Exilibacterium tricleocarpae]